MLLIKVIMMDIKKKSFQLGTGISRLILSSFKLSHNSDISWDKTESITVWNEWMGAICLNTFFSWPLFDILSNSSLYRVEKSMTSTWLTGPKQTRGLRWIPTPAPPLNPAPLNLSIWESRLQFSWVATTIR